MARDQVIQVKLSQPEKTGIIDAAKINKSPSYSEWCRLTLGSAARAAQGGQRERYLRLSDDQLTLLEQAAHANGQGLDAWILDTLMGAAEYQMQEDGPCERVEQGKVA